MAGSSAATLRGGGHVTPGENLRVFSAGTDCPDLVTRCWRRPHRSSGCLLLMGTIDGDDSDLVVVGKVEELSLV
jgi:hypothetical protein